MSTRELLRANDTRFVTRLADLTPVDWAAPSLCDEWTNHDVLAHLVVGMGGAPRDLAAALVRRRGAFDAANTDVTRALSAARTPTDLLADFDGLIHRPRGLGRSFPRTLLLGDHVTHELDICHALGVESTVAEAALVAVLNAQVTLPNPFVPAFRNSRGLRLVATDVAWTHGTTGPQVRGSAADLISVLGDRPAMAHRLDGEGAAVLAARVLRRYGDG